MATENPITPATDEDGRDIVLITVPCKAVVTMLAEQFARLERLGVAGEFELARFKTTPVVLCRANSNSKWLEAAVLLAPIRGRKTYSLDPLDLRPEHLRSRSALSKLREYTFLRVLGETLA